MLRPNALGNKHYRLIESLNETITGLEKFAELATPEEAAQARGMAVKIQAFLDEYYTGRNLLPRWLKFNT